LPYFVGGDVTGSGTTGNATVTDLRLYSSRGYSLHDGVTHYIGKATYYWSPVSERFYTHLVGGLV